ncbi:hypothetical protein F53441_275 [Fusarium austroafricanum]|uniref:Uncharacterized protein n=1 Tax=Fusarium austroafricanum TaxID=2364996 RepID=A0A8H4PEV1_9HYPO|nr:hypothetical protein F53441_275 [Fusarium austroafricanum]
MDAHVIPYMIVTPTGDYIKRKASGEFYLVAVASCVQQRLKELHGQDFLFELASEKDAFVDVLNPTEGEKRIYGVCTATQKTQSSVIRKAVIGVTSPGGRGLARYYRKVIYDQRILVPVEWASLIRDITTSPSQVRNRFLLSCLFLSLHLLDHLDSSEAFELLERKPDTWLKCLRQIERETTVRLVDNANAEMHKISLVRGMLDFAGHNTDVCEYQYDRARTVNDNLNIIAHIFDIERAGPVPNPFGAPEVLDLLLRSGLVEGNESSISELCEGLPVVLPIRSPPRLREAFPANLINKLGLGK